MVQQTLELLFENLSLQLAGPAAGGGTKKHAGLE